MTFTSLSGVVRIEVAKATLDIWKSDTWHGCQVCQNRILGKVDADLGNEGFQPGVGAVIRGRRQRLCADSSRKQGECKDDCA